MVDMQSVRDRLKAVANEFAMRLVWAETTESALFRDLGGDTRHANIVSQFETALRTVLICTEGATQSLVFLLSSDGSARTAENLLYNNTGVQISPTNFIARCEVRPINEDLSSRSADPVVLWIDDPAFVEEPRALYQGRVRKVAFEHYPWLADEARQRLADRKYIAKMSELPTLLGSRPSLRTFPVEDKSKDRAEKIVLFALYWLDFGGAEAFALRMMEAAKADGYRVIVVCDEPGRHRVLERAARVADAIYLLGSYGFACSKEAAMLRIVQRHQPDIVHVHHSWVGYRLLPALHALGLAPRVIDTTHILEYRFGDFVSESVRYSAYIDTHHVISNDLAQTYIEKARVPADRVRLGKLYDLSRQFVSHEGKWSQIRPLQIAFVGRFVQQKRPYLFVKMVEQLVRKFGRDRFAFTMVGEGLLLPATQELAQRLAVRDLISFLPGNAPVADVLGQAHVLVVCSENEGLTLVGFEAARAQAIVVSTDVGAQREIVASSMLVPRHPLACVQQIVAKISGLADNAKNADAVLNEQKSLLATNMEQETGTQVCLDFYAQAG